MSSGKSTICSTCIVPGPHRYAAASVCRRCAWYRSRSTRLVEHCSIAKERLQRGASPRPRTHKRALPKPKQRMSGPGLEADFLHAPCHFAKVPKPEVATTPPRAKSSGRKTKIGSPAQLHACLFRLNVAVGLRDVVDARLPVVDGQQSGIGRRIDVKGRMI